MNATRSKQTSIFPILRECRVSSEYMRQRQSRRLQNQAKKAREERIAAYFRRVDTQNATRPRRSLRLLIKREITPYRVILFGEKDFWLDDPEGTGLPPPDGYRIVCDDSTGDGDSTSTGEEDSTTEVTASDITSAHTLTSDAITDYTIDSSRAWDSISEATS